METEIYSKAFGKIQISENQVINFPDGLLGFEDYKKFALLEKDDSSVFKWLQSIEEIDLAFVVVSPTIFHKDFNPKIPEIELNKIQLNSSTPFTSFVIVTIPGNDPGSMTANMQGPLIINTQFRVGKQFISQNERYTTKHKILDFFHS